MTLEDIHFEYIMKLYNWIGGSHQTTCASMQGKNHNKEDTKTKSDRNSNRLVVRVEGFFW